MKKDDLLKIKEFYLAVILRFVFIAKQKIVSQAAFLRHIKINLKQLV